MTDLGATDGPLEPVVPPRIARLEGLQQTPRRRELRRLAAAGRSIIEHLVSTTASIDQLTETADALEHLDDLLAALPREKPYEGFSEAANAGESMKALHGLSESGDVDPELWASFDHSPLIGLANPLSPPMVLSVEPHRVLATATFGSAYEGPPGCVHGGYIAAAFDELLGATQSLSGTQGMTARLTVNYRSPTPLHEELRFEGVVSRRDGRKIFCDGRLFVGDRLCAESEGLFISMDPTKFRAMLAERADRFEG